MRKIGAFLLIAGSGVATGYLLYWILSAVIEFIPIVLKVAVAAAFVGFILLVLSIVRERLKTVDEFKEVEK